MYLRILRGLLVEERIIRIEIRGNIVSVRQTVVGKL